MAERRKGNGGDEAAIVFDYIKSPQFRSIHADGAIGGITPNGQLHFVLFNERTAIPRQLVHMLKDDGTLGAEIEERRIVREGIVREMDVDVYMPIAAAESLCTWLQEKIAETKKRSQS